MVSTQRWSIPPERSYPAGVLKLVHLFRVKSAITNDGMEGIARRDGVRKEVWRMMQHALPPLGGIVGVVIEEESGKRTHRRQR